MQKTKRLKDKNSVLQFQTFLILLSFIAVGSESQISVDQVTLYSNNVKGIFRLLGFWGGGREACAETRRNLEIFSRPIYTRRKKWNGSDKKWNGSAKFSSVNRI